MDAVSVDTTFIIDLERERAAGKEGSAYQFLRDRPHCTLFLSVVALGEFARGFPRRDEPAVMDVARDYILIPIEEHTALAHASICRQLDQLDKRRPSANDIWIASAAIASGIPLLTANENDFRNIQGLEVLLYR